jgi:hypothetical protein
MGSPSPSSAFEVARSLHTRGDLAQAERLYWAMIGDGSDAILAAHNLFVLLRGQRRWADIRNLYLSIEPLIPRHPDWAEGAYKTLLLEAEFEAGWQWYEARRHASRNPAVVPSFSFPEWRGEDIRSLLVWTEQGFGDEIMFARYLPLLAERRIEATFVCRPALARLFSELPVATVAPTPGLRLPSFERWALLASLPLRLGTRGEIPPPIEVNVSPSVRGGIGVMAKGSPSHANDAARSLPADAAQELLSLPGALSLDPQQTGAGDFYETAQIVAGLDLVIAVDTAVAHLAGSLGKPCWLLLPHVPDWRWRRDGADSPWYPSIRIFRQPAPGDWASVLGAVRRELEARTP